MTYFINVFENCSTITTIPPNLFSETINDFIDSNNVQLVIIDNNYTFYAGENVRSVVKVNNEWFTGYGNDYHLEEKITSKKGLEMLLKAERKQKLEKLLS